MRNAKTTSPPTSLFLRRALVAFALILTVGSAHAQVSKEFPEIGGKVLKVAKQLEKAHKKAQGRVEAETEKLLTRLEKARKGLDGATGDTINKERRNLDAVIATLKVGAGLPEETLLTLPKALDALADHDEAVEKVSSPVDELVSELRAEIQDRLDKLAGSKKRKKTDLEIEDLNLLSSSLPTRYALYPRITAKKLARIAGEALPEEQWQAAIDAAVQWLVRHQSEDGGWKGKGFEKACTNEGAKCAGAGSEASDAGITGLALLALIQGADPQDAEAQAAIDAGLRYLVKHTSNEGLIGSRPNFQFIYGHAIAALSMSWAKERPTVDGLEAATKRAVGYAAKARNPLGAWRYDVPPGGDNDTSITGWMVALLAAARENGLEVDGQHFEGAMAWLEQVTDKGGRVGYTVRGSASTRTPANKHYPSEHGEAMTASGLCMLADLSAAMGKEPSELLPKDLIARMKGLVYTCPPARRSDDLGVDLYYWMLGARALRGDSSTQARMWRLALGSALLDHQGSAGCPRGSWDPTGVWGHSGGRVYATAAAALALSVAMED